MAYPKKKKKGEKNPATEPVDAQFGTLIDWVNEADDATIDAREMSEKCRSYYDSSQYTAQELSAMKARKQAPVVINRIKPKIDGLMGMERSNRTTAKAYPRTPKHEGGAMAATEAVRFVLDDNMYRETRSSAWDNMLIEGTGGVEVMVEPKDDGFKIVLNQIMWDRIIYDPYSRRKDFSDARFKGQVVWLDYDIAVERFPGKEDMLETMMNGSSSTYDDRPRWIDGKRRRVKIVELYYQKDGDVWYTCFTRGGYLKDPKISPYVNEEGETEDPYEFGSLFVTPEGHRYGAVRQYLDVQDEINKRRSKALHLMSVRQVRWERGAVEDINKAREELAKPDGVIETTPGMEFEVLKTNDMAQAQFKLLEDAKLEIDAVGYSAAAAGKEERLMSGIALRNREAAAQTELAPMFDVLKHMDVRVYRKIWNRVKQYWKDEMWIRVTDDEGALRFVGLNKPVTQGEQALKAAQAQGMPPEQLQMLAAQLQADPMAQQVVSTENEVAELDVDIVMDDAPDSVTMQQEEFTALAEMVKSGIPIPPTAIVSASNLKDKEKILKEMREGMALPPEMQEKLKAQEEEFGKLKEENVALKADQQTEMMKVQQKAAADQQNLQFQTQAKAAELEQQAMNAEREFALKKQQQDRDAQLAREKAEAEYALKEWMAGKDAELAEKQAVSQVAITQQKHAADADVAERKLVFEMECRAKDDEAKRKEQAKAEEAPLLENAMPKFVQALKDIVESNAKALELIAKELSKPKTVQLGGIQRSEEGITGASATVQ